MGRRVHAWLGGHRGDHPFAYHSRYSLCQAGGLLDKFPRKNRKGGGKSGSIPGPSQMVCLQTLVEAHEACGSSLAATRTARDEFACPARLCV